jgi:CheY-specific phosphatase CheX
MAEIPIIESLSAAAADVLETMFFSPVTSEAAPDTSHSEHALMACLKFSGGRSGSFTVSVSAGAADTIAANFLGEETNAPEPGQVRDVICELANMICGSALSRLDREAHFDLQHPELVETCSEPTPGSVCCLFEIEGGYVTLCLQLDSAA